MSRKLETHSPFIADVQIVTDSIQRSRQAGTSHAQWALLVHMQGPIVYLHRLGERRGEAEGGAHATDCTTAPSLSLRVPSAPRNAYSSAVPHGPRNAAWQTPYLKTPPLWQSPLIPQWTGDGSLHGKAIYFFSNKYFLIQLISFPEHMLNSAMALWLQRHHDARRSL